MVSRMKSSPPVVISRKPSPLTPRAFPKSFALGFIKEVGLELLEVPVGLLVGVEDGLSTLALRDPDRAVTFELSNPFTGVTISSRRLALGVRIASRWLSFAPRGDECDRGIPASRGPALNPLPARAAMDGIPAVPLLATCFLLSTGISRLAKVAVMVEEACGVRIMALLSARRGNNCAHRSGPAIPRRCLSRC